MSTYGSIRLRLSKLAPGIDLELIDGWIQDRYTAILDALPWKRLEGEVVLQSPASVNVGTVTASQGSATIIGAGTAWALSMVGLIIRIANAQEYYVVAQVTNATTLTLDRAYEQPNGTALSYRMDQAVFQLPAECRIVRGVRCLHSPRPLELTSTADLNRRFPNRATYGIPRYAAATWDSVTNPPLLQLELYPIPDNPMATGEFMSFPVDYIFDPAPLDPNGTSTSLLPWTKPAALIEGVQANIARHMKDYVGGAAFETQFLALVKQMAQINALQRGPQAMRLATELRGRHGGYPGWHRGKHADQDYFDDYNYDP